MRGRVEVEAVDATLRRESRNLRTCYDRALMDNPTLQGGTIDLRFVIDPVGRVIGVPSAAGMTDAPGVADCVGRRVRYIRFPPAEGGAAEVALPFTFQNGS